MVCLLVGSLPCLFPVIWHAIGVSSIWSRILQGLEMKTYLQDHNEKTRPLQECIFDDDIDRHCVFTDENDEVIILKRNSLSRKPAKANSGA